MCINLLKLPESTLYKRPQCLTGIATHIGTYLTDSEILGKPPGNIDPEPT
jgi:hypothetical protein